MTDAAETREGARNRPLTAFVRAIMDGRFLRVVFLAMLALSAGTVAQDFLHMQGLAPEGAPGLQRIEPVPIEPPKPGDQTRPYLPRTMPLGPGRSAPRLPGVDGPPEGAGMRSPMAFSLGVEGRASALGTIDPGASERLKAFLEKHDRQIGEIVLHSPGGSVSNALAMARMIRAAGISTSVPANGYCASSCPLLLASGLYRKAGKNAYVGVHQIFALPNATGSLQRGMASAQTVSAAAQELLIDMGVDPKVWLRAMQTQPDKLYIFTPEELRRYRLANATVRVARPVERPEPARDESL